MLEVCIDSLDSAANAINGGADELEVCSSLNEGGLTPSMGLVMVVQEMINSLPVENRPKLNVMIRCRGGNDFYYSEKEMLVMLKDIKIFKAVGVDQFVFGALTNYMDIHEEYCTRVRVCARPNKVTFSRAFDLTRETKRSAAILAKLGFYRVLTSGQQMSAIHSKAIPIISYLAERYRNEKPIIMPGAGITPENVGTFINMGCKIVHSSCKSTSKLPKFKNSFELGVTNNGCMFVTDIEVVRQMKKAINLALLPDE